MHKILYIVSICLMANLSITSWGKEIVINEDQIEKSTFTYKKVGDAEIEADLYRVKEDETLKPVIVWIHGGGLIFGSRDIPKEQMNFYLAKGYSIVSIDYRLAPATGLSEILLDVQDAILWVRKNGENLLRIDPDKVFVIGHSAGAYLALLTGISLEVPPQAIISFYGYGDILEDWAHKPDTHYNTMDKIRKEDAFKLVDNSIKTQASFEERFNFYVYCRQNGIWANTVTHLDREKHFEELSSFCPVRNISHQFPPTLLIHGDKDTDVPFSESVKLAQAFKANNIDYEFIVMEGYDHVFDLRDGGLGNEKIKKTFEEVDEFLKRYK